jgi:hypothetical protein
MSRSDAPVAEPDVPVDLPSIAAIKTELYRRWVPAYSYLTIKIVPAALLCGVVVHWVLVWLTPGADHVSSLVLPMIAGAGALSICLWSLASMLWLDFKIDRRLDDMARRIAAGETVYANEEVGQWRH